MKEIDFAEIRSLADFDNSSAKKELLKIIRERDATIIELENKMSKINVIEQPKEYNFLMDWNNFFGISDK